MVWKNVKTLEMWPLNYRYQISLKSVNEYGRWGSISFMLLHKVLLSPSHFLQNSCPLCHVKNPDAIFNEKMANSLVQIVSPHKMFNIYFVKSALYGHCL
jgi:hypothetical protein